MSKMMFMISLLFFCIIHTSVGQVLPVISNENINLQECVRDIVEKYFSRKSELRYLDFGDYNEIIKVVSSIVPISSEIAPLKMAKSYVIMGGTKDILGEFPFLARENSWNPHAKFLIITGNASAKDLNLIFHMLLKYHILEVLVVNEGVDPDLYTYNPYENYGCGKRYDKIIEYGKCSASRSKNLYPVKLVTGLQNCSMEFVCMHYPPYAIDPKRGNKRIKIGIEQFVLKQLSYLENFTIKISYENETDVFSMILNDTTIKGPLKNVLARKADGIFGATFLTYHRAQIFSFIQSHLSYSDILYVVKRSSIIPAWKNLYLEFDINVWVLLILAYFTYCLIFIIFVKPKDKVRVIQNMFECFFFSSKPMSGSYIKKVIWLYWVVFAFFICAFYQSSLVSLANNPSKDYQISTKEDIQRYDLKPCLNNLMRGYIILVQNLSLPENHQVGCNGTAKSLLTVSNSSDLYTVVFKLMYSYRKHNFIDDEGNPTIYAFKEPLGQVAFAIYFYKGFPMLEKLNYHALRLRENGLIQRFYLNMQWRNKINLRLSDKNLLLHLPVSSYILACGYLLSTCVFLLEVIIKKCLNISL